MPHNPTKHMLKRSILDKLVTTADEICIQETHPRMDIALDSAHRYAQTHSLLLRRPAYHRRRTLDACTALDRGCRLRESSDHIARPHPGDQDPGPDGRGRHRRD